MGMNAIIKKGIILAALAFSAFCLFQAKADQDDTAKKPVIINNEPVVYLDNTDQISVQGEGIQSVIYSSDNKKVAKISQKGKITPRKKGTVTIRAKVTYQAEGQSREETLSYSLKVLGKSKEYFIYLHNDSSIVGLTEAGKKLKDVYIPERYQGKKVRSIFSGTFADGSSMERLYLSDYVENTMDYVENSWDYPEIPDRTDRGCNRLREIHLGKKVEEFWISNKLPKLEKITVDPGNKDYQVRGGVLFAGKDTLVLYPAGKRDASYTIPKGVTGIADCAFAWAKNLKHVSIPSEIKDLDKTFQYSGLEEVTLPEGLEYCASAFQNCADLEKAVIPKLPNYRSSYRVFEDCRNLKTVSMEELPGNFTGANFSGCSSLEKIQFSENVKGITRKANVVFDSNMETLLIYPAGKKDRRYQLPAGVKKIHESAFEGAQCLTEVVMNQELQEIGDKAFQETKIQKVQFNYGLLRMGDYAFYHTDITALMLPNSVSDIGWDAFSECRKLQSVKLPKDIEELRAPFRGCASLRTLHIPKKVKSFNGRVGLEGCSGFPESDEEGGCTSLASITVEKGNKYFTAVKGVLFNKSKTTLLAYPAAKKDRKYSVPKSVKKISGGAFVGCNNLRELTMKDQVKKCGDGFNAPFYNMGSLKKIRLSKNLEKMEGEMFAQCSKLQKIRIPDKVKTIHEYTFDGCTSLKSITLGKHTRRIQEFAFRDCRNLRKLVFREKRWNAVLLESRACFARTGSSNYGKLAVHVPKTWKKKKLVSEEFRYAGLSKKAKIKFY